MFTRPSMFGPPAMFRTPGMFTGRAAEATGVESEWCVSCDGVNDWINGGNGWNTRIVSAASLSVCGWVYISSGSTIGLVSLTQSTALGNGDFRLYAEKSGSSYRIGATVHNGAAAQAATSYLDIANGWHHVAMTWESGSSIKIYVDGTLSASSSAAAGSFTGRTGSVLQLGKLYYNFDAFYLGGRIDDVRIYNRALSSTEVTALYENTSPTTDGLVAYLDLEEGSGTSTAIKNGSGANIGTATLAGATWSADVPAALAP